MKDWDNEEIFKGYLNKNKFKSYSIYFGDTSVKQMYIYGDSVKISHNGWTSGLMDTTPYVRQRFLNEMREFYKC